MTTSELKQSADNKIQDSNGQGPNDGLVNGKEFTPEFIEEIRKILDAQFEQLPEIIRQFFIWTPNRNDAFITVTENMLEDKAVAEAQEREKMALAKAFELYKEGIEKYKANNYEEALTKFQAAISVNSKNTVDQKNKAHDLFRMVKLQETLDAVKLLQNCAYRHNQSVSCITQFNLPSRDIKEKIEIKIKEAEKIAAAEERAQKIAEIRAQNKAKSDKFTLEYNQKREQQEIEKKKLEYQKPIVTTYLMNDQKIQGLSNSFVDENTKEKIEIKIKEAEKIAAAEERAQKIAEMRAQDKAELDQLTLNYKQKKEQLKIEEKKLVYQKPIITTYLINNQKIQGLSNSFIDENTNEEIKFVGENLIKTEKIAEAEL